MDALDRYRIEVIDPAPPLRYDQHEIRIAQDGQVLQHRVAVLAQRRNELARRLRAFAQDVEHLAARAVCQRAPDRVFMWFFHYVKKLPHIRAGTTRRLAGTPEAGVMGAGRDGGGPL
ncbi:hypothetical protein BH23ACT10_BH23ACT10_11160 [soil metagenome]